MVTFTGKSAIGVGQITDAGTTSNDADSEIIDGLANPRAETVDNTNAFTITNVASTYLWEQNIAWRFTDAGSPPNAQITVTVPASPARGLFGIINATSEDMAVTITSQPLTAPVIGAGEAAVLSSNGTNVELLSSGAGTTLFTALTDTPANFTGAGLDYVRVNSGETALEYTTVAPGSTVSVTPPSQGCLLSSTATQAITTSTATAVAWDSEIYDTDSFHDNVTNNTRITIPAGVTKVKLTGGIVWETNASGFRRVTMTKNGSSFDGRGHTFNTTSPNANMFQNVVSAELDVAENDYFELIAEHDRGSNLNVVNNTATWFSCVALESDDAIFPPHQINHWENGTPATSGVLYRQIAERAFTLDDALAASVARFETAPSGGTVDLDVDRNGTKIGTISWADGSNTATFSTVAAQEYVFAIGDRLTIDADSAYNSAADLIISLWGWRS